VGNGRSVGCVVAAALWLGAASVARAQDVEKLAKAVEEASFPNEKQAAARKLAALKSEAARTRLLALFASEETWTRDAAAFGLTILADKEGDRALAARFEDASVRGAFVEALPERKAPFPASLIIEQFEKCTNFIEKREFVDLVGKVAGEDGDKFLVSVVKDTPKDEFARADLRKKALETYAKAFKAKVRPLALELVEDDELGDSAFKLVIETGSAADLPRALDLIRNRKDEASAPIVVVAYEAVVKWGDAKVQLETYLDALRGPSDEKALGAMGVFKQVQSPEVTIALCRLARRSPVQRTRVVAAMIAADTKLPADRNARDPVVACLVPLLKEAFEAKEGSPLFFQIITLGLSNLFDAIGRKWDKEAFDATLAQIGRGLERRTGEKHTTHEDWLRWALSRGYTVEGTNLIQQVFSPNPERRLQAQDDAARLLGFAGRDDFVKKTPGLAGAKDGDVAVQLAKGLVAKGLLEDEGD
jgi:hypothetical protein